MKDIQNLINEHDNHERFGEKVERKIRISGGISPYKKEYYIQIEGWEPGTERREVSRNWTECYEKNSWFNKEIPVIISETPKIILIQEWSPCAMYGEEIYIETMQWTYASFASRGRSRQRLMYEYAGTTLYSEYDALVKETFVSDENKEQNLIFTKEICIEKQIKRSLDDIISFLKD